MKKLFFAVAFALVSMSGMAQNLKANMDESVKPGDDFWQYAVGTWLKNNPLDKVHPENGAFTDLSELNKDRINALVMKYAEKKDLPQGSDGQKIGTLYRLYMDSVGRNKMGYEPILPYLKRVREVKTREEALKLMCEFDAKGFNTAPFGISLSLNPFNSSEFMIGGGHGGASLAQEYYAEPNEQQKKTVEAIKARNKDYLKMVGYSDEEAQKMMEAEWAIEHAIGMKTLNQVARRNPMATIHIMSWEQLLQDFKGIDWVGYRDALDMPKDIDKVNISQLEPLHEVENILANTSLEDLKAYMELHVIQAYSGFLSDAFTDRAFEANKVITGVQEQQPRWKRAVNTISGRLGETIGKLYVAEYFPESSKQRVVRLVKDLQQAFEDRLTENTWMSDSTKAKALEKLHSMYINVGYPDKWEDMEKFVDIREDQNLVENFIRINEEARAAEFRKYWRKPVDKTMMACTPQTVNAFYNPLFNSINFPAAILQPPFFNPNADDAVNYGAIGVVIGHEMTHGFDDQGRLFDKDGNMISWWTEEDDAKFREKANQLAAQYDEVEVLPGVHANGQLTLGENIADHGGLSIAFTALQNAWNGVHPKPIDGFTAEQRFWLGYARVWAQNITEEEIARRTQQDVHSLGNNRVNVAVRNFQEFFDAFGIKEGDPMYRPESERVRIW